MSARTLMSRSALAVLALLACAGFAALLISSARGQGGSSPTHQSASPSQPAATPQPIDNQTCLGCHETAQPLVNAKALASSQHKDLRCQDCHTSITEIPHTPAMVKEKARCANCHPERAEQVAGSVHSKTGPFATDHPNCIACHSDDPGGHGDPHGIKPLSWWTRPRIVALCATCHSQAWRMKRHGPVGTGGIDTDAVLSYYESFHGRALLRFGNTRVAICSDCHGIHTVLPPDDPRAPTNRANVAQTCGKPGCHQGAKMNFAESGANHLRLKIKESPVLRGELFFFRALIFCVIGGMLSVIVLDLRKKVFGPTPPASGRLVAFLIAAGFLAIIVTIALATMEMPGAFAAWLIGIGLLVAAFVVYFAEGRIRPPRPVEEEYERLPVILRIHHALLFMSFTTLAATGLPLRFALARGVPRIHMLFGGFASARMIHRGAAIVLILTWVWHLLYLLYRWHKNHYSLKSWTMLPNLKDLQDVIAAGKYYLGLSHEEPQFGRFQFREKMDYLAEYWGMPVMICTGFVLWFPIFFGNRLPEVGLSFAYIAHSYEATLAFLAIVTWHMYNAHLNPATFPMNPVWLTGRMSRSEMEREHPLELARIEAEQGEAPPA